ncbi:MAG: HD domain-containing protein [SAR324 cluster bacterium]|nr:HD domain-containing protein [SAR324 cluster bacterium]
MTRRSTKTPPSSGASASRKGHTAHLLAGLRFAAEKHRDDRRKGPIGAPYINHPIAVAEQLADVGLEDDWELLVAAVLHDVIEDTDATSEELEAQFGTRVKDIVLEVSDDKSLQWRERKRVVGETIGQKSQAAQLVKLSDLIANVSDLIHQPPNWSDEQKKGYLMWAEWVVKGVKGVQPTLERRFAKLLAEARQTVDSK